MASALPRFLILSAIRTPWSVPDRAKNSMQDRAQRIRVHMEPCEQRTSSQAGAADVEEIPANIESGDVTPGAFGDAESNSAVWCVSCKKPKRERQMKMRLAVIMASAVLVTGTIAGCCSPRGKYGYRCLDLGPIRTIGTFTNAMNKGARTDTILTWSLPVEMESYVPATGSVFLVEGQLLCSEVTYTEEDIRELKQRSHREQIALPARPGLCREYYIRVKRLRPVE